MTKRLRALSLSHSYHDGQVIAIELGPQREVVLHVRLDPVWNEGDASVRRLSFSAIQNFEEVEAFFARAPRLPDVDAAVDEVIAVVQDDRQIVGLDLARLGYIQFHGAMVREL